MTYTPEKEVGIKLWMRVVFFISLATNLLVVGALVGLVITKALPHDRRVHSTRNLVQPFIQALEPGDRKLFHQSIVKVLRQLGSKPRLGLMDWQTALALLTADPFVRLDFAEYLTGQFKHIQQIQGVGSNLLLDRIAEMSTEECRAYADRFARQKNRGTISGTINPRPTKSSATKPGKTGHLGD